MNIKNKKFVKIFSKVIPIVVSFIFIHCEIDRKQNEEFLLKTLSSETTEKSVKLYILKHLEELHLPGFYKEIKKYLQSKDTGLKLQSAYNLIKVYKDPAGYNALIEIASREPVVKNPDSPVGRAKLFLENKFRADAIKYLGETGDEKVVPLLEKLLKDSDGNIVDAAYFSLALLSSRDKVKLSYDPKTMFYDGLKDLNPKVRVTAIKYLGELKDKKAVSPISLRLKDHSKDVRREALLSLGKIGEVGVLQEMVYLKGDKEDTVRVALAEGLGFLGETIKNSTEPVKIASLDRIKVLLSELLNDYIGGVRVTAAVSLLRIGDKRGIEVIKKGLKSSDVDVRIYCIESLGKYGMKEDIEILYPFLEDKDLLTVVSTNISILKILSQEKGNKNEP